MKSKIKVFLILILCSRLCSCDDIEKNNFNLLLPDGIEFSFVYVNSNYSLNLDTVKNVGLVISVKDHLDSSYIKLNGYLDKEFVEDATHFNNWRGRNFADAFNFDMERDGELDKRGNFVKNGFFIDYYIYDTQNASVFIYYRKYLYKMLFYNFENPETIEKIIHSINLTIVSP